MQYKSINMKKVLVSLVFSIVILFVNAQDSTDYRVRKVIHGKDTVISYVDYDPGSYKAIPDKVFEFGIPFLLILLLVNALVTIFRVRAEARLKEKAIDKGMSESTLITLFKEDSSMIKYSYLKWFLVLAAVGVSLIYIHFLAQYGRITSGYLSLGVISLFVSIALLIYYRIIRKKV